MGIGSIKSHNIPVNCEQWPKNIVDIKCGFSHTLALTSSQEVYSCGRNIYGQLGRTTVDVSHTSLYQIPDLREIARIECGEDHSICIDSYDNLYFFGCNESGELGFGDIQKITSTQSFRR